MVTKRSGATGEPVLISMGFLLVSVGLAWFFFGADLVTSRKVHELYSYDRIRAEIMQLCPDDPLLASRVTSEWLYVAKRVAEAQGSAGLRVLDCFGDEAVDLFENTRRSFGDLSTIIQLDGALYAASTGPWRKAVVEWARAGRLTPFVDYLKRLRPDERERLRDTRDVFLCWVRMPRSPRRCSAATAAVRGSSSC